MDDKTCAEHAALCKDVEHIQGELASTKAKITTAYGLIEHRAPRWVLILLTGIFVSIAGAQFLQMDDIKERVIQLQTKMEFVEKRLK